MVSWKNGKKEHLQKRHLLFSLREAHALFLKENPEVKIGLSKFSSLRPLNVLLSSEIPRNVCLCQYHENIKLICDCLKRSPNFQTILVILWKILYAVLTPRLVCLEDVPSAQTGLKPLQRK